jgi:hypothetical protein
VYMRDLSEILFRERLVYAPGTFVQRVSGDGNVRFCSFTTLKLEER